MNLPSILLASFQEGLINRSEYYRLVLRAMKPGETMTVENRADQTHILMTAKRVGVRIRTHKLNGTGIGVERV